MIFHPQGIRSYNKLSFSCTVHSLLLLMRCDHESLFFTITHHYLRSLAIFTTCDLSLSKKCLPHWLRSLTILVAIRCLVLRWVQWLTILWGEEADTRHIIIIDKCCSPHLFIRWERVEPSFFCERFFGLRTEKGVLFYRWQLGSGVRVSSFTKIKGVLLKLKRFSGIVNSLRHQPWIAFHRRNYKINLISNC